MNAKFRGLTKETNRWCYGYYIKTRDGRCWIQLDDEENMASISAYGDMFVDNLVEVLPHTVGQWVMKKRNIDLYVGDTIKCWRTGNIVPIEFDFIQLACLQNVSDDLVVKVGNIFEQGKE